MKLLTRMKKLNYLLVAVWATGAAQVASGLNYSPTDLLLIFRQDNQKDVEISLGSVSNYLELATGTAVPVSFNKNVVATNFPQGFTGVKFALVATTSQTDNAPRAWLTNPRVYTPPANLSFSAFSVLNGKIDNVGVSATLATVSNSAPFVASTSSSSSYDYIVTGGAGSAVSTMYGDTPVPVGGLTPLPVDAVNPTTMALYQVTITTSNPKPAAQLVGAFTLDIAGNLTFHAGALPPLAPARTLGLNLDPLNQINTVSFSTVSGVSYSLQYSTSLSGGWTPVPGAGIVAGDGTVKSLVDQTQLQTDSLFYRVRSNY